MSRTCPRCGYEAPAPSPLTQRQHGIMAYITAYIGERGYAPSGEEIAEHAGFRSLSTVHEHLTNLERKGWIRRRYNEARSIEIVARLDEVIS